LELALSDSVHCELFYYRSLPQGYLWSGPLTPAAFQIADDQAVALVCGEAVVDAKVPMNNAEGVEADQGVDEVEKPRLVHIKVGTAYQGRPRLCQLHKDQQPVGRSAKQTNQMLGEHRTGTRVVVPLMVV